MNHLTNKSLTDYHIKENVLQVWIRNNKFVTMFAVILI